jgi:hypothetical protein
MSELMSYVPDPIYKAGCELRRIFIDDPAIKERARLIFMRNNKNPRDGRTVLGSMYESGNAIRAKKPGHIPILLRIKDKKDIKLIVPNTWAVIDLMVYSREHGYINSKIAVFLSSNGKGNILRGYDQLSTYDEPGVFPVMLITAVFENTFG